MGCKQLYNIEKAISKMTLKDKTRSGTRSHVTDADKHCTEL